MSSEIDLSGESDPTERMVEQHERAHERAHRDDNVRTEDHDGSVETDDFSVEDALDNLE